jgi:hypothetical protein
MKAGFPAPISGNRDLRFLFLNLEDCLEVRFLGNHDEIRQEIRTGHHA